jgi:hypothetical protein
VTRPDTDLPLHLGGTLAIGLGAVAVTAELDVDWAGAAVLGIVALAGAVVGLAM